MSLKDRVYATIDKNPNISTEEIAEKLNLGLIDVVEATKELIKEDRIQKVEG